MSQLSKNDSKGGSSNPNPGPLIATPIILPRAFTIAFPLAPWPLLPIKSTLGGPHLRTLVSQFGALGNAGIPSAILLIPSARFVRELNPAFAMMLPKSSGFMFETPPFVENFVGLGHLIRSQSRTFVRIFENWIAFENVLLGSAMPPPWILFNWENIVPRLLSRILLICPNMSPKKFSIPQIGTSKTWPIMFSKLFER